MRSIEPQMRNCASGNLEIPGSPFGRPGMTMVLNRQQALTSSLRNGVAIAQR
jgi:hypothetical protein